MPYPALIDNADENRQTPEPRLKSYVKQLGKKIEQILDE